MGYSVHAVKLDDDDLLPIKRAKNKMDVMTSYIVLAAADSCFDGNTGNEKCSKTVRGI